MLSTTGRKCWPVWLRWPHSPAPGSQRGSRGDSEVPDPQWSLCQRAGQIPPHCITWCCTVQVRTVSMCKEVMWVMYLLCSKLTGDTTLLRFCWQRVQVSYCLSLSQKMHLKWPSKLASQSLSLSVLVTLFLATVAHISCVFISATGLRLRMMLTCRHITMDCHHWMLWVCSEIKSAIPDDFDPLFLLLLQAQRSGASNSAQFLKRNSI